MEDSDRENQRFATYYFPLLKYLLNLYAGWIGSRQYVQLILQRPRHLKIPDKNKCEAAPNNKRHGRDCLVPLPQELHRQTRHVDLPVAEARREGRGLIFDKPEEEIELDEVPHAHTVVVAYGASVLEAV